MAGLFDIGILVFKHLIANEYGNFMRENKMSKNHSLEELELLNLGITHQELGSEIVQKWWHLSPFVIKAVNEHYTEVPNDLQKVTLSQIVDISNKICNSSEIYHNFLPQYQELFEEMQKGNLKAVELLSQYRIMLYEQFRIY